MQIRFGYELIYQSARATPMILNLNVHATRAADLVRADHMTTEPHVPLRLYRDEFGNMCTRLVAPAGQIRITTDAVITDRGTPDPVAPDAVQCSIEALPEETLVYLLGSRYCDTDNLSQIAWQQFGNTTPGWARVQAICDFVHAHLRFGYEFARPTKTASEAYNERQGVCRDYAHLAITSNGLFRLVRGLRGGYLVHIRCQAQCAAHRQGVDCPGTRRSRCRNQHDLRPHGAHPLQGLDPRNLARFIHEPHSLKAVTHSREAPPAPAPPVRE